MDSNSIVSPRFTEWREINPGSRGSFDPFLRSDQSIFRVGTEALGFLKDPRFTKPRRKELVKFYTATVKELTGWKRASVGKILRVVMQIGSLCDPEDVIPLREQYIDQPDGEFLHLVMRPIQQEADDPTFFVVCRLGRIRWIRTHPGRLDHYLDGGLRMVFPQAKPTAC